MHACLNVDEILRSIVSELIESELRRTAISLACCCKTFEDPVLDVLWGAERSLTHLLRIFPQDIWGPGEPKSLTRLPTAKEWASLQKYAQRVRTLTLWLLDPLPLQVLSVLRFHPLGNPLLPNLKRLKMVLTPVTQDNISFLPLFFSPRTTAVKLAFTIPHLFNVTTASMIASLPLTCPDLREVCFHHLPQDPVIIRAVSHLVTATRGTLWSFKVGSTLTQEAIEILYKSPHLRKLHTLIDGRTLLPTMELPNLVSMHMHIDFPHYREWLQGFHGASFGKLDRLSFCSESESIGGFLEEFERVALTTSIPTTLSTFTFHTVCSWMPNYHSLLQFTHLTRLNIESSCFPSCSSMIDDRTITDLAQALHKLEFLSLGGTPCEASTGVTMKGLSALAYYCPNLDHLCIHFQIPILDLPKKPTLASPSESREVCALTYLDVGDIRIPEESMLMVALILIRIFPNLEEIDYFHTRWREVVRAICGSNAVASCSKPGAVLYTTI